MKEYKVTQEQILILVESLAILQDSDLDKKEISNLMSFSESILQALGLDEIVNNELEYLNENKINY
jgi:hypothetical protein